jgi:hypothetical protein
MSIIILQGQYDIMNAEYKQCFQRAQETSNLKYKMGQPMEKFLKINNPKFVYTSRRVNHSMLHMVIWIWVQVHQYNMIMMLIVINQHVFIPNHLGF